MPIVALGDCPAAIATLSNKGSQDQGFETLTLERILVTDSLIGYSEPDVTRFCHRISLVSIGFSP